VFGCQTGENVDNENNDNPTPTLNSITPDSANSGDEAFTLTAEGSDFINGSIIIFDGKEKTTTFVSSTQIKEEIEKADIVVENLNAVKKGENIVQVSVKNPSPGGGTSNSIDFKIYYESNYSFNEPVAISEKITMNYSQKLAFASFGSNYYAAWGNNGPNKIDIFFNVSMDGGTTWGNQTNLTNSTKDSWSPYFAIADNDKAYFVWREEGSPSVTKFMKSSDGGNTWTASKTVSNVNLSAYVPKIIWEGNSVISYIDDVDDNLNFKKSNNGGDSWFRNSYPVKGKDADSHSFIRGKNNSYYVIWQSADSNFKYSINFTKSTDNGVTWSDSKEIFPHSGGCNNFVSIAYDNKGYIYLAFSYIVQPNRYQIYFMKSKDEGNTWTNPIILSKKPKSDSNEPTVLLNSSGDLLVFWSAAYDNESGIFYSKSSDYGDNWSEPICALNRSSFSPNNFIIDKDDVVHTICWTNSKIYYSNTK
jgi:hypothetical protein